MQAEMPKKYWRNLPETALIPTLLQEAPRRVENDEKERGEIRGEGRGGLATGSGAEARASRRSDSGQSVHGLPSL